MDFWNGASDHKVCGEFDWKEKVHATYLNYSMMNGYMQNMISTIRVAFDNDELTNKQRELDLVMAQPWLYCGKRTDVLCID